MVAGPLQFRAGGEPLAVVAREVRAVVFAIAHKHQTSSGAISEIDWLGLCLNAVGTEKFLRVSFLSGKCTRVCQPHCRCSGVTKIVTRPSLMSRTESQNRL